MGRHVVLIHRYYQPDTPPYAAILARIAEELRARGHRVTVLTCQPSYNRAVVGSAPRREVVGGTTIIRFRVLPDRRSTVLKLVNACWFSLAVLREIARLGPVDTVMSASTPPVLEGMTGRLAARLKRARFVYHHQDIYPEVLGADASFARSLARRLDAHTDRSSDAVVVLSRDMRDLIASRGVRPDRIVVLNNFDPWEYDDRPPTTSATAGSPLRVLYGGNLGRFQNLGTVFQTLLELRDEGDVEFTFVGDGALSDDLRHVIAEHGLTNVTYVGHEAPDLLSARMRTTADVGLVSLGSGVVRAAYPSKVMSYLRNALPVLALVEPDSELGQDLVARRAGWVVSPERGGSDLASMIRSLMTRRSEVADARSAARAMYEERFGPDQALRSWSSLLASSPDGASSSGDSRLG